MTNPVYRDQYHYQYVDPNHFIRWQWQRRIPHHNAFCSDKGRTTTTKFGTETTRALPESKTWSYSILENRPDASSSIPFGSARLERGVGHNVKRYNRTPGPGTNVVHRMESSMGVWCRWSFFFFHSWIRARTSWMDHQQNFDHDTWNELVRSLYYYY